ncbi:hypothetical protein C8Q75DRAFT_757661 [Abortiporus biennis]|nr:hypothetical protein C8Q75DRAFT_757661 [Abortiporus biennis]
MARQRRDTQDGLNPNSPFARPLRIVASGTLFLTHTLSLPTYPEPASVVRAHSVSRSRGGSASTCLSILAQFPSVDAILVAPLGGNEEGHMIIRDLENDRVSTRFCKIWDNSGVPSAWVLHADDDDTRTVINNNPLPDITHEEFVSLLGPVLVPENYAYLNNPGSSSNPGSPPLSSPPYSQPRPSTSTPYPLPPRHNAIPNPNSPAPLDWIHFEGRSVKTTLNNLIGLDGLAKEKKWRSHCVFSVDVGRRARQGVEALIPHADVIFLNKHYALAHSPAYASSPRAFLLSFTNIAPKHALLVAHWGTEGAAVLSLPTREYFQSSGWVEQQPQLTTPLSPTSPTMPERRNGGIETVARDLGAGMGEIESVRSGSGFWAGAGHHTESSSEFTASAIQTLQNHHNTVASGTGRPRRQNQHRHRRRQQNGDEDSDSGSSSGDSDDTQIAGGGQGSNGSRNGIQQQSNQTQTHNQTNPVVDEVGAADAFISGMMYALSRRMLPGEPYTPSAMVRKDRDGGATVRSISEAAQIERERGRWRLEECLRFATELSGRKARRNGWDGLAEEMARAGWFEP